MKFNRTVMLMSLAATLCGCESSRKSGISTGLNALAKSDAGPSFTAIPDPAAPSNDANLNMLTQQAALNLQKIFDSGAMDGARRQPAPGPPVNAVAELSKPEPKPIAAPQLNKQDLAAADAAWDEAAPEPSKPEALGAGEKSAQPEDPVAALAARMAHLLRQPADGQHPRISDAVALAAIESISPGALADLDSQGSALGEKLSPEDRGTLLEARDRVIARPGEASETLVKSLSRITPPPAIKVASAVLCSRVMGFGRYDPLPTETFIAGQPIRAIVYAEVEGFMSRPARPGDPAQSGSSLSEQVSVELSQSLTLYHDQSGLQAWHRPARSVVETTRQKRRDFYLIQQIELPATLSIGRYNLKVTVKDKTSGSECEAILPIAVVADRSAVTSKR